MFGKKKRPAPPLRLSLTTPTWFFLIKVRVIGDEVQPWIAGSEALVQAFSPVREIERALQLLDDYLPSQELLRIDTLQARRYDAEDEFDELPEDYMRTPLESASSTGQCQLGIFIITEDTAWPRNQPSAAPN